MIVKLFENVKNNFRLKQSSSEYNKSFLFPRISSPHIELGVKFNQCVLNKIIYWTKSFQVAFNQLSTFVITNLPNLIWRWHSHDDPKSSIYYHPSKTFNLLIVFLSFLSDKIFTWGERCVDRFPLPLWHMLSTFMLAGHFCVKYIWFEVVVFEMLLSELKAPMTLTRGTHSNEPIICDILSRDDCHIWLSATCSFFLLFF